ncbi:MAG: hydroxymethylglutaryl-CoA reductase (NADPH) [Thermoprotei archaeon]|nr:MAG: hydroxymethylglutaryl-CoA reductase (NADPH) [Thermoprotei archaeon]RLF24105.1 MAG: hydroxymethylglutaryl-CoA reductase (NADPH) [Thermoprotei archaeon]
MSIDDELVEKLVRKELKFYKVEGYVEWDVDRAASIRRKALEKLTGAKLEHIGSYSIDLDLTKGRNIEVAIGCAQIPMAVAGPLKVKGDYADGEYFIPLCTTEGALVASVNRGCSAITASGGARSKIIRDHMTRAPLFVVPSVEKAVELVEWVREHIEEIRKEFESVSPYLKLLDIRPWIVGRNVWLRFEAYTYDAMGMNMVTIGCDRACKLIEKNTGYAKLVSLSGNLCVDKKPNAVNWLLGRGKTVVSEAVVKRKIVEEKLKTTPEAIVEVNVRKNLLGSGLASAYGLNAHIANIVAAIFIATGQDVAQVVESSMGITMAEVTPEGDLYISVTLPSLEVATVGGGTGLPTQREALAIMGCAGPGDPPGTNCKKFAEIVAAACLAGELSLLAALAAGHLAEAHERLGWGKALKK